MVPLMSEFARIPEGRAAAGLPYRPCVGITLFNRDGLVFIGHRSRQTGDHAWQMPQGGIDEGEAPREAALRELYEETNVSSDSVTFLGETSDWLAYDLPPDVMKRSWIGRYRGQKQKWFAFGFTGAEDEIDVAAPGGGQHAAEFEAWRWAPLETLPGLVVPFKRAVYEGVVAAFSGLAGWRSPA
ncbi:RNA pyrophosphohydrolase [Methylobacterium organophilum]|uniref:RNA pyrophosphohydrolase n=2 Tax=Methylobacterium organophilum TaxID=410 RepID=A0ABQ4T5T7_METOR|nr:RNA pyrophosphohydrolase [Methylobacterium organophilum]